MTKAKILVYCAFLEQVGISLPDSGVNAAAVQKMVRDELCLLWSEVEWPFDSAALQRNAVEFHHVVSHIFSQTAVVPFRLLSIFDDSKSLEVFITAHQAAFIADLERLRNLVQMECVLYFTPQPGIAASGKEYLERKRELRQQTEQFINGLQAALGLRNKGISFKEVKKGGRIFVLVERGNEQEFRFVVETIPVPDRLSRRMSGPWPAAEFLTETVKMPGSGSV